MKFFADTADIDEIRDLAATGLLDGVTTNPSLVAKAGRDFFDVLKDICAAVEGPVSAEVTATDYHAMVQEGRRLADFADNIAVKVPLTWDGLKACKTLRQAGAMVNVTLCFSATQALFAAKAGATFVSPFVGRLDDISADGMQLIRDIRLIYDNYPALDTAIRVASIRPPLPAAEAPPRRAAALVSPPTLPPRLAPEIPAARAHTPAPLDRPAGTGAAAGPVPPAIFRNLADHPLTDKGLNAFLADWQGTGQSILDKP